MSSGSEPEVLKQAADLRFLSWGGQDLNLRPTDYEFDPALSRTREIEPREPLTSGFSPQRTPTLRNVSQSVAGPMRDTSLAAHAEHRESQLLCIRTNERVGPPTHRPPFRFSSYRLGIDLSERRLNLTSSSGSGAKRLPFRTRCVAERPRWSAGARATTGRRPLQSRNR